MRAAGKFQSDRGRPAANYASLKNWFELRPLGSVPIDTALSGNSGFLYVRTAGNGGISGYRIDEDGSLTPITTATGVPAGAQGIAAR